MVSTDDFGPGNSDRVPRVRTRRQLGEYWNLFPEVNSVQNDNSLDPWRRELLKRLLEVEITDVDTLQKQAAHARFRALPNSISFTIETDGPTWKEKTRVPIEATAYDNDRELLSILLHVVNGLLDEVEILRPDGDEPTDEFPLDNLEAFPARQGDWNDQGMQ